MNAQVAISVVPQHSGGAKKLWQLSFDLNRKNRIRWNVVVLFICL